jgi:hypothetical protein
MRGYFDYCIKVRDKLLIQSDDLTLNLRTDAEEAEGRKRGITPIGGAARIEEEDTVHDMTGRLMAVAIDDAIDLLAAKGPQNPRFKIVFGAPAMDETDPLPRQRHNPPWRQLGGIEITAHRQHWSRQEVEELRIDNIAGVEDQFRPGKVLLTTVQQYR